MRELNILQIARTLSISKAATERLLDSTRIYLLEAEPEESEVDGPGYELGLRLLRRYLDAEVSPQITEDAAIKALRDYAASCPAVYAWLCSGGFRADRIPETVKPGTIVHSCRTAGRIRAETIRNCAKKKA